MLLSTLEGFIIYIKGRKADEEAYDQADSHIPKIPVTFEKKFSLYLYSYLFAVCDRGIGEIWSFEGRIVECVENSAL